MLSLFMVDIEEAFVRSIGNEARLVKRFVTKISWPLSSAAFVSQKFAHRVKDLESLQNQVAQNHGKELVDEQALEEMELLRHRVMQLEGEASSRAEDTGGPAGHGSAAPDTALADLNAELMHEMEEVRRRVMELQVIFTFLLFRCWCLFPANLDFDRCTLAVPQFTHCCSHVVLMKQAADAYRTCQHSRPNLH